ncbi:MAG TPA: transposase [Ktedonobacterales bacterium]|nr:transposase [Ktedonobacterales bacterium]
MSATRNGPSSPPTWCWCWCWCAHMSRSGATTCVRCSMPRRWVVERSFAWASRLRRLARDYERLPQTVA